MIDCCNNTLAAPAPKPKPPLTASTTATAGHVGKYVTVTDFKNYPPDNGAQPTGICWLCATFWAIIAFLLYHFFIEE